MGLIATETNGEPQDTETLYRAHGAAVGRLCRSLLRDRGEAEDATQQVFLSVHRALLNGAAPRDPLPWLLTVARNECYSRFRQRAAAPAPSDAADGVAVDASVHVLRAGELADMWDEVGRLPTAQREAFLLREIRGLSYGQLADELALTPPSVRSLLLRARARLRRRLGDAVAGLGSLQWIQTLFRLVAGSESAAPVHVAARAAALGIGARTSLKEIERLRAFFKYCVENDWIAKNPAKTVKPPQIKTLPRLPFSNEELQNILAQVSVR